MRYDDRYAPILQSMTELGMKKNLDRISTKKGVKSPQVRCREIEPLKSIIRRISLCSPHENCGHSKNMSGNEPKQLWPTVGVIAGLI